MRHSFQFLDELMQGELIAELRKRNIAYRATRSGEVLFSAENFEVVENEILCAIRDRKFPAWQIFTCPAEDAEKYRMVMQRDGVPYHEEMSDGALWFLLPRKYRPHSWKIDSPAIAMNESR